jgi:uncharacterized protein (DUF697 family)
MNEDRFLNYTVEVRKLFLEATDAAKAAGIAHNLPAIEICIGIALAAISAQAIAIVGSGRGGIESAAFDGFLEQEIDRIKTNFGNSLLRLN